LIDWAKSLKDWWNSKTEDPNEIAKKEQDKIQKALEESIEKSKKITPETILEENNVHLYISGHHHAYFPAYKNKLKLLHTGALGSGPRSLLNSNLSPRNTLTVVDINLSPQTTVYTTYDMKTLEVINLRELPEKIDSLNRWVLREEG
jgi:hypothetical protein